MRRRDKELWLRWQAGVLVVLGVGVVLLEYASASLLAVQEVVEVLVCVRVCVSRIPQRSKRERAAYV